MRLRDYQARAVADLPARLNEHRRVVAVAPTGSGKTVIGAAYIKRSGASRVLWIAHRIELLRQAFDQLRAAGLAPEDVGILSGPDKRNLGARVLVAGIDSLRSRETPHADLIVVDEAHRIEAASYQAVLDARPDARVLGLTATPWRLDGKGLGETFADLFVMAGPTELIADGFIARPITYGVPREKARAMVAGVSSRGGDFAPGEAGAAMMRGTLMGDVVSECARLAPGQRTLVFAASREHGQALATRFKRAKRPTAYLDGETAQGVRDAIVGRLVSGETEIVVNVDVLTEGFDCPPVTCIAMARPTKSLTRFLQYVGRASRPFEERRPLILDHAGNTWRHNLPEAEREWTLDGRPKGSSGEAPVKLCTMCDPPTIIPAGAKTCPNCGHEQPLTEREIEEREEREIELERLRMQGEHLARAEAVLWRMAAENGRGEEWVRGALARVAEGAAA